MGKYPPSKLHNKFSDWHWEKCAKDACLTDIDRIWVDRLWMEQRNKIPVAVYDIKKETKDKSDPPTNTEKVLADWFEEKGVPYYLVYIRADFSKFILYRHLTKERLTYLEKEMIEWINNGCPRWGDYKTTINIDEEKDLDKIPLTDFMWNPLPQKENNEVS